MQQVSKAGITTDQLQNVYVQFTVCSLSGMRLIFSCLHYAPAAVQCIVISPVCLFVCGCVCLCVWVCYHDNSKLRASILTKLGL